MAVTERLGERLGRLQLAGRGRRAEAGDSRGVQGIGQARLDRHFGTDHYKICPDFFRQGDKARHLRGLDVPGFG